MEKLELEGDDWKLKGLGRVKTDPCGCTLTAYPGGKVFCSGCNQHKRYVKYVCQVCGSTFKSDKEIQAHRWTHSY